MEKKNENIIEVKDVHKIYKSKKKSVRWSELVGQIIEGKSSVRNQTQEH